MTQMKNISEMSYRARAVKKEIQKWFGYNPSKTTVFEYLGFTEERYWQLLPDDPRGIIPENISDDDLRRICERVIQQLTNAEEDLVASDHIQNK